MPKNLLRFSKQQDELLIEKVKSNPILFDVSDKNHKNVQLREDIWRSIDKFLLCPRKYYTKKRKPKKCTSWVSASFSHYF